MNSEEEILQMVATEAIERDPRALRALPPQWFFESAEAVQALRMEAASWLGTPFRPHSKAKGETGGVYCAGLAEAILAAVGAIRPCSFSHGARDYQPHRATSRILEYLRGEVADDPQSAYLASRFAELPVAEGEPSTALLEGDLLLQKFFGNGFHLPLVINAAQGKFIHAVMPAVSEGILADSTYAGHTIAHFRVRAL